MLQLGKTGYTVGREIVLRDPWYRWQVLDGSKPILSELQNLCGEAVPTLHSPSGAIVRMAKLRRERVGAAPALSPV